MEFDGDVLKIELDMTMDDIRTFEEFIRPRLEYLEMISIDETTTLVSSALLSLLVSLKKTRPDLQIPFLDKKEFSSSAYGTVHWIAND
ncbi:MAG: hypothetical protein M1300_10205 [Epsilonproteobacteria bacterium]|nr:hypothetical protein [Campylobacterota bacterium]